jgi:transposase InsO family protein/transposase
MRCHANARLSPIGRRLLIERIERDGWTVRAASEAAGSSERSALKWLARWRAGEPLTDRSSARLTQSRRTDPQTVKVICALRALRFSGPEIAELLQRPCSTVCAVLKREGLGRLGRIGLQPAARYERARPGELIHIDVKKLGRIQGGPGKRVRDRHHTYAGKPSHTDAAGVRRRRVGWDAVHVAVDDATRLAYAEVLPDEKALTAVAFLRRAIAFFARYGITVARVLTDNGSPYRARVHALACHALGVRHLRTRPYRPQTNGKAERFIRTMLNGWAYGAIYASSTQRTQALDGWLWHYNHRRAHTGIGRATPITRLNNLLGTYT